MANDPTDAKTKGTIAPAANGPLIVRGVSELKNSSGVSIEHKATMALCRCGGSATKPFCDGTHARNGFSGDNTADRSADRVDRYSGPDLDILDNRFVCAHIGACTDSLKEVFLYGQEPWIDPNGAATDRIREAVAKCPSGALAVALKGSEPQEAERAPSITVARNGPYYVEGGVDLEDAPWGKGATRQRYALCRCGQSRNKPFCDGSHWDAGFTDDAN